MSRKGTVISIHTAAAAAEPMASLSEAYTVPGEGLEGDRYFKRTGTFSDPKWGPDFEVTLIEIETIEALAGEKGIALEPKEARRNIVTRGIALNHLVGREFRIGDVALLRGIRLCEPCSHIERLTQPGVLSGLIHRGGLRARILTRGTIRVGDAVLEQHESFGIVKSVKL